MAFVTNKLMKRGVFLLVCCISISCLLKKQDGSNDSKKESNYQNDSYNCSVLDSLFTPLKTPLPGEWLYDHKEKFQSFESYKKSKPRRPTDEKKIIYIQPIGSFDSLSLLMIDKTKACFESYFGLPVKINKTMSDSLIPEQAKRVFESKEQWQSSWILEKLIKPNMPDDALVMIALTLTDLFPDKDWNFVFGQASVKDGAGVWSFARLSESSTGKISPEKYLLRILKTALHETTHALSLPHCTRFECLMNGSNGLSESDPKPIYLCSDCLSKFCWNLSLEPKVHLQKMAEYSKKENHKSVSAFYENCIAGLNDETNPKK